MKFDQDLCLNLQYDFGKMNSTLGSVVPLAMFVLSWCTSVFSALACDRKETLILRIEDCILDYEILVLPRLPYEESQTPLDNGMI